MGETPGASAVGSGAIGHARQSAERVSPAIRVGSLAASLAKTAKAEIVLILGRATDRGT